MLVKQNRPIWGQFINMLMHRFYLQWLLTSTSLTYLRFITLSLKYSQLFRWMLYARHVKLAAYCLSNAARSYLKFTYNLLIKWLIWYLIGYLNRKKSCKFINCGPLIVFFVFQPHCAARARVWVWRACSMVYAKKSSVNLPVQKLMVKLIPCSSSDIRCASDNQNTIIVSSQNRYSS